MPYVIVKTRSYESVAAENAVYAGWGCLRIFAPLYVYAFAAWMSISGIFSLVLRVFMSREAIAHHRQTTMKGIQGGLVWAVMVGVSTLLVAATEDADSTVHWQQTAQWFWGTAILWGIALAGWLLSGIHELIANVYPDKVHGNGYGLVNLIALIPGVRPRAWLTYVVEILGLPVCMVLAGIISGNGDVQEYGIAAMALIAINISIFFYPIFYLLLWRHDYRFRNTA